MVAAIFLMLGLKYHYDVWRVDSKMKNKKKNPQAQLTPTIQGASETN
jgi:hypothetical protein